MSLLALYGTLMRSAGDTLEQLRVSSGLRLVGPCRIAGQLLHLGDYPGLVAGPGDVHGELWQILDPDIFDTLDAFEDCAPTPPAPAEYRRERTRLLEPQREAWVYRFLNPAGETFPSIDGGNWLHAVRASA